MPGFANGLKKVATVGTKSADLVVDQKEPVHKKAALVDRYWRTGERHTRSLRAKLKDVGCDIWLNQFQYVQKSPSPRISCVRSDPFCLRRGPPGDLGADRRQARPAFLGSTDVSQIGYELWLQGVR